MRATIFVCLVILSFATAFAQDRNTGVTVTVSSSVNLTPSDVSFQFGIASGTTTTLDDVIAALPDTLEFQGYGANILPSTAALDDARAGIVLDLIASARKKAQAYAAAAQIKIGPVLSVNEGSSFAPNPIFVPCCFGPPSQLGAAVTLTVRFGAQ